MSGPPRDRSRRTDRPRTTARQDVERGTLPTTRSNGEKTVIGRDDNNVGWYRFKSRFLRRGKSKVGWGQSFLGVARCSWLNILLIFIPLSWTAHFLHWRPWIVFLFSFLAIIPLEKLFDFGGDQMSIYVGKDIGDLLIVTLNNAVEAALALILLIKCEMRLLQATIAGVVLLHLLLVPGTGFLTGGARVWQQHLNPHVTQINHSLLTIGVLCLLIPVAFYTALESGPGEIATNTLHELQTMSHGLAVILICVYVASRIFLYNPPGDGNALEQHPDSPEALKEEAERVSRTTPKTNPWVCMTMLVVALVIMAFTAEWLVDSLEEIRKGGRIKEEWYGLILLPLVSYAGDGSVTMIYFARFTLSLVTGPVPPPSLARARPIENSIQFTLFWMPLLVIIARIRHTPFVLLFDLFEVALLLGACFLVNGVTQDNKTSWCEGFVMIAFYFMIALCSWFYTGKHHLEEFLHCVGH